MNYGHGATDNVTHYPPLIPQYTNAPPYVSAAQQLMFHPPPPYIGSTMNTYSQQSQSLQQLHVQPHNGQQGPQPVQQFPLPLAVPHQLPNSATTTSSPPAPQIIPHGIQHPNIITNPCQSAISQVSPQLMPSAHHMLPTQNTHIMSTNKPPCLPIPNQYFISNASPHMISPTNALTSNGAQLMPPMPNINQFNPSLGQQYINLPPDRAPGLPNKISHPGFPNISMNPEIQDKVNLTNVKLNSPVSQNPGSYVLCSSPTNIRPTNVPAGRPAIYPGMVSYVPRPTYGMPIYTPFYQSASNSPQTITVPMPNVYGTHGLPIPQGPVFYQQPVNTVPVGQQVALPAGYIPQ